MGKVTITIEDSEDGSIDLKAVFDPPIINGAAHLNSQKAGLKLLDVMDNMANGRAVYADASALCHVCQHPTKEHDTEGCNFQWCKCPCFDRGSGA